MKPSYSSNKTCQLYFSNTLYLNSNKNITQKKIGELFNVSQSTIAHSIKETRLQLRIHELEKELSQAKSDVIEMKEVKQLGIPDFIEPEYKQKP